MACSIRTTRGGVSCFTLAELRDIAASVGVRWSVSDARSRVKARIAASLGEPHEIQWVHRVRFLRQNPHVAILAFKPPSPGRWLNEMDINIVMEQFVSSRPKSFSFAGTHPCDFSDVAPSGRCVEPEWCGDKAVDRLVSGAPQVGLVLNTDTHDRPGSHWVSLYLCMSPASPKYGAFFFDSVGTPPPARISRFIERVRDRVGDPAFRTYYNEHEFQMGDTECGIFCISFLVACVRSRTRTAALRSCVRTDEEARDLRVLLFRGAVSTTDRPLSPTSRFFKDV